VRGVPGLLEEMNQAAADVNLFEQACSQAVSSYQERLAQWNVQYRQLRTSCGYRAFERASRLIRAEEVLEEASRAVEAATAAFCACADGTCASTCLAREGDCVRALAAYQEAQRKHRARHERLSERTLKSVLPRLRQLLEQRAALASEQERLAELGLRVQASKHRYGNSMAQLEKISEAIHCRRRERFLSGSSFCSTVSSEAGLGGSNAGGRDSEEGGEASDEFSL